MMQGACAIELGTACLSLLPARAMWWGAESALVVADVHLGKAASFRASGVPVPEQATAHDLERLSALVKASRCERLVVLGDLVHDAHARNPLVLKAFRAWREMHADIELLLVEGNHDRKVAALADDFGIRVVAPGAAFGGLTLLHEPGGSWPTPTLCGHLHPGYRVRASRSRRGPPGVRAACFWRSGDSVVLPAFGSFTGLKMIEPVAGDEVFLVGPESVVQVLGDRGSPATDCQVPIAPP